MKKWLIVVLSILSFVVVGSACAATSNEGLWVRNWVGWGETQHWTDISDMIEDGSFTEVDPIFESWKTSTYQDEQNQQWTAINDNTSQINYLSNENNNQWTAIGSNAVWNMIQQGQINNLGYENTQQWNAISNEATVRQLHDQLLNNKINVVDFKAKMRDLYLNNKINVEAYQRMVSDQYINNASIARDEILNNKINNEAVSRQYYDQLLNGEINEVDYKSKVRDLYLNNRINSETYQRMVSDKAIHNASVWRDAQLQDMIDTVDANSIQRDTQLNNMISDNTRKIQDNSDRISDLEDPKFNVIGSIRFHDSRKWQINAFAAYDVTNERLDRYGLDFMYKVGPSYEEKLIEKLEKRIEELESNN